MAVSQNGWIANNPALEASQLVPGTLVKISVRKDAAGQLLLEVASAFDRLVQDIDNARGGLDDWGYAQRPIRGGSTLSNHASGTAIDLNATKHPLATAPSANFTAAQIAQIHKIVAVTGGVVRWGGDYTGRKDGMHFEINDGQNLASCAKALAAMRQFNSGQVQPPAPKPPVEDDMFTDADRKVLLENNRILRDIWQQLAGPGAGPGEFTGWPPNATGSGAPRTLVDYGRQADVQLEALKASVAGLAARQV